VSREELETEYLILYREWCRWCADWATARLHAKDDIEWTQKFNGFDRAARILSALHSLAKEINALPK
jgi:hypothetical protein